MVRLLIVNVGCYVCSGLQMRSVRINLVGTLRYEGRGHVQLIVDAKESRT